MKMYIPEAISESCRHAHYIQLRDAMSLGPKLLQFNCPYIAIQLHQEKILPFELLIWNRFWKIDHFLRDIRPTAQFKQVKIYNNRHF